MLKLVGATNQSVIVVNTSAPIRKRQFKTIQSLIDLKPIFLRKINKLSATRLVTVPYNTIVCFRQPKHPTCRLPDKDLQFNFGFLELGYLDDEFSCRISASCRRRKNLTISISLLHLNLVE